MAEVTEDREEAAQAIMVYMDGAWYVNGKRIQVPFEEALYRLLDAAGVLEEDKQ